MGIPKWLRGLLVCNQREWMLWMHESSGKDQVGRVVDIDGCRGRVIDGTVLKILVEWD
jgi:hypothetical protein